MNAADERVVRSAAGLTWRQDAEGYLWSGSEAPGEWVPAWVAELVEQCDELRPIARHAVRFADRFRGLRRFRMTREVVGYAAQFGELGEGASLIERALAGILAELQRRGHLQNSQQLGARLSAASPQGSERIGFLVIPTANRPALLERALESYLSNLQRNGRALRVYVGDDSPNAEAEAQNARVIQAGRDRFGFEVEHITRARRAELVEAHASADAHRREALEFLLLDRDRIGQTYGQNRNALLLASRGACIFSADDDTLCEPLSAGDGSNVRLCNWGEPIETFSRWPSREAARAHLRPWEGDFLAVHERVLARPPAALLGEALFAGRGSLPPLDRDLRALLLTGSGSIALSSNGLLGDSGSSISPLLSLLEASGGELTRLQQDAALLDAVAQSREVIKASGEVRLAAHGTFMSGFFGLDNRALALPFMPHFRRGDLIFKEMLLRVRAGAMVAHLPFTLEHAPLELPRRQRPVVSMSDVLLAALRDVPFAPLGHSEADLTRALGHRLVAFAEQPMERYRHVVVEAVLEQRLALLAMRRAARAALGPTLPEAAASAAAEADAELSGNLGSPLVLAEPALLERFGAAPEAEEFMRQLVARLGRALVELAPTGGDRLEIPPARGVAPGTPTASPMASR